MERLSKLFEYFPKNRKSFQKYSIISFIVGLLELCGVALTYPFVLKLLSEENTSGYSPLLIGIVIILIFLVKNVFMIFYSFFQANLTRNIEKEMNLKFINYFITSPYTVSSKISLAQKGNILGFLIPNIVNNFVLRYLNLNINFFIFGLISFFLIIKFPFPTLTTILFAILLIILQNKFFKPKLRKLSEDFQQSSIKYNQRTNEVLLNLKNVKISNNEIFFYEKYKNAISKFFKNSRDSLFLNSVPPYITEPFIIILLFILLAIISYQNYTEPQKLIASFALIVSAIFRLAPTISRIQVNLNGINIAIPQVDEFLGICFKFDINNVSAIAKKDFANFKNYIELQKICFEYEPKKPVLKDISFRINKGEFIGIAGLSGVGKTTLADIISGLINVTSGEIIVDGEKLCKPIKIGYIPQEINTITASIRENVAFGYEEINDNLVKESLKKAQLYDFIDKNYKDGIYANPFVDSSGFSQGQKQRLAIARALYSNPDILIMDEATSSLDLKTEEEICNVLNSLKTNTTIIAIAHRLSTIKTADKIVFLKGGMLNDIGSFEELSERNNDFKELVKIASLNKSDSVH